MNGTIVIESDVSLQLVIQQVVLKIPARTQIRVGETIQIKKKPLQVFNKKRQSTCNERPHFDEPFCLTPEAVKEPEVHEPMSWNNIQLIPDVSTGQLTPMPTSQTNWSASESLWSVPLPPLDLQTRSVYEDLTPSTKQIIDEIREMNLWSEPMTPEEMEEQVHQPESEEIEMLEQLELEEEVQVENERSESRDTAEVLSEYDICDNCDKV